MHDTRNVKTSSLDPTRRAVSSGPQCCLPQCSMHQNQPHVLNVMCGAQLAWGGHMGQDQSGVPAAWSICARLALHTGSGAVRIGPSNRPCMSDPAYRTGQAQVPQTSPLHHMLCWRQCILHTVCGVHYIWHPCWTQGQSRSGPLTGPCMPDPTWRAVLVWLPHAVLTPDQHPCCV